MQNRDSLFDWGLPAGVWAGTRVRLSPLLLLVPVVVTLQRQDVRLGFAIGFALLIAAALQEAAFLAATRKWGHHGDELLLWPLGRLGRSESQGPGLPTFAQIAVGPLTNLAAAMLGLALLRSDSGWGLLHPLRLPAVDWALRPGVSLLELAIFANWVCFLAALLPAPPLAMGRFVTGQLVARLGTGMALQTACRIGATVGTATLLTGLVFDSVWLCALGAALIVWNLREALRHQIAENFDESFMGYDFSQGYTSLERSVPVETPPQPGLLQRWQTRRRMLRDERQRQKDEQVERQLDALLDKVHQSGIASLTEAERRLLERASQRYRGRPKAE